MVTIILAHPWHGSFNKVILDTITKKYDEGKKAYQVIDLYKDNFNPVLAESDLALFSKGQSNDPLVKKYQEMLKNSDEVVFLFPVWWMSLPAILKGFFDKVFLYGFAYDYEGGWNPLLKINKTTVITTSEQETVNFKNIGDPIDSVIKGTLNSVGMNNATWYNCDKITSGTDEHRKSFLDKIEKNI